MTVCNRRLIDPTRRRTVAMGMLRHSSWRALPSSATLVDFRRLRSLLPSSSHMCSMQFMSGETAGQSITSTLRKSCVSLAECALALSCWNVNCWFPTWRRRRGTRTGARISSMYRRAVSVPFMIIRSERKPELMAPNTMTLPLPNRSRSRTQLSAKRSCLRR